jgi:hypothetical protein
LAVEDDLAVKFFAPADTCFFVLGVADFLVLALLAFALAADACPSATRGKAQAHISTRALPAPSHLRIFA